MGYILPPLPRLPLQYTSRHRQLRLVAYAPCRDVLLPHAKQKLRSRSPGGFAKNPSDSR
jgi:hypothetical protein